MVARAFPIDFGESGATLQGAFRVLDRILSLGVVSDSTGISPTQLPGDRLLARVDGTLVWSIHPESLINSDMPTTRQTGSKTPKLLNWHHRRSRRGSGRIDALASI